VSRDAGSPYILDPPWQRVNKVQIRYESRALQAYMLAPIVLGRFQSLKPGCVSSRAYCHLLTCERSIRIDLNPILTRLQAFRGNLNRSAFYPPTFELLGENVRADRVSGPHLRRGRSIHLLFLRRLKSRFAASRFPASQWISRRGRSIHLLFFETPEIAISRVSISRVSVGS
jgi:hypothetical protein